MQQRFSVSVIYFLVQFSIVVFYIVATNKQRNVTIQFPLEFLQKVMGLYLYYFPVKQFSQAPFGEHNGWHVHQLKTPL